MSSKKDDNSTESRLKSEVLISELLPLNDGNKYFFHEEKDPGNFFRVSFYEMVNGSVHQISISELGRALRLNR